MADENIEKVGLDESAAADIAAATASIVVDALTPKEDPARGPCRGRPSRRPP